MKWLEKLWIAVLSIIMIVMVIHMIYEGQQPIWYNILCGIYGFYITRLLVEAFIEELKKK